MGVLPNNLLFLKPTGLVRATKGQKAKFRFELRAGAGSLIKIARSCNSFVGKGMLASGLGYPVYYFA
jgi:hypothetical protein